MRLRVREVRPCKARSAGVLAEVSKILPIALLIKCATSISRSDVFQFVRSRPKRGPVSQK
ncbi:unnamed protein product [Strongylus vulgaris]|uniref:Uncharacterized protein n=1 Tax=Strongylus vulgaris TaxID=40348 RepID=A0A3P7IKB1_STRVU|nr:unnamed protein product [Strongylus vulgaris]